MVAVATTTRWPAARVTDIRPAVRYASSSGCAHTPRSTPISAGPAGRPGLDWLSVSVFMVNRVRPGPSSYLLRAGFARRRGRRTSGSHGRSVDCLLYTSDAADEEDSVDLGGRRIIK